MRRAIRQLSAPVKVIYKDASGKKRTRRFSAASASRRIEELQQEGAIIVATERMSA